MGTFASRLSNILGVPCVANGDLVSSGPLSQLVLENKAFGGCSYGGLRATGIRLHGCCIVAQVHFPKGFILKTIPPRTNYAVGENINSVAVKQKWWQRRWSWRSLK
ncbi:uncharacterized protein LOC122276211 [Carya illinoinensis]|uniref:uncharacterized protein LOC122276211 n=1 Tax=Carya illinoinensis TaxID=32201 RepID=UPI001C723660|nr:uncharacterized protein LOC122276211 [Carya illinoinensis]